MVKKQNLQKYIINMRMVDKRLEHQRKKIQREEMKMMKEVKEALAKDDIETARLFAKDIARSRKMSFNLQKLRSKVKTMAFKLEQANAVQQIAGDLRGLVKSLYMVNRTLAIPQMENILFAMESEMTNLDLTTETLDEGLDSAFESDETEDAEADKILEEMKASRVATTESSLASTGDNLSEDLEARLQRLKGEKGDN